MWVVEEVEEEGTERVKDGGEQIESPGAPARNLWWQKGN